MDKIKSLLRYVRRQQFWLICPFIILLGVVSWWKFTSELKAEKKSNLSAIKSADNLAQGVRSVAAVEGVEGHPNQIWEEELIKYMDQTRDEVAAAWQVKDEIQAGTLVWPEALQDDFIRQVQQMRPIEAKVPYPPDSRKELTGNYLERYANYIELELPKLAEIIRARWAPTAAAGRGRGGGFGGGEMFGEGGFGGGEEYGMAGEFGGGAFGGRAGGGRRGRGMRRDDGTLVDWSPKNQGELLANHFDWSNTSSELPSTLQVLYAQEDYWVLKALMHVIANTNEGATGRHNTKIRSIYFLHIGKDVGPSAGSISEVEVGVAAATGGFDGESEFGNGGMSGMGGEMEGYGEGGFGEGGYGEGGFGEGGFGEGGFGEGGMFGTPAVAPDPAEKRYVDKNYEPLAGDALRAAMTSTEPEDAYLAVAKRMPVRMRFQMEQRAIPRLLLACSNSPLTIEVRQVRVYRDPAKMVATARGSGRGGGAMGPFGGGGMPGGGMYGEGGPGGGFSLGGRSGNTSAMKLPTGLDVAVEVYGIIYIYNPVDRSKLGVEEGEEGEANFSDDEVARRNVSRPR